MYMKSLIFQNMNPKINDFLYSFWHNLTFSFIASWMMQNIQVFHRHILKLSKKYAIFIFENILFRHLQPNIFIIGMKLGKSVK